MRLLEPVAKERPEKSGAEPDRTVTPAKVYRYLNARLKRIAERLTAKEGREVTVTEALEIVCADAIEEYYLEALAEEMEEARQHRKNRPPPR